MALAGIIPSTFRPQAPPASLRNQYAGPGSNACPPTSAAGPSTPEKFFIFIRDSIAELGFDIVWLMGVWRRSPESRRITLEDPGKSSAQFDRPLPGWKPTDAIASPYAVAAYVPDARIGTRTSRPRA